VDNSHADTGQNMLYIRIVIFTRFLIQQVNAGQVGLSLLQGDKPTEAAGAA